MAKAPAKPYVAETPVGVDVYTDLATAEDDRDISKDSNAITAEDQRELQRRKADNKREEMLIQAGVHVQSAKAQRVLYRAYAAMGVAHTKAELPHNERSYCLVADYGQNMESPSFHQEQPGCAYYYLPCSVYNFGVVNHSHLYPDGHIGEHLHCHVYHEGVGKKGANNVASLLMKTMKTMGILREDMVGGELTIVFDNCSGQNKNNTVLNMVPYLVEMKYFLKVQFVFLVVGHTKNACDHLFNALKKVYRRPCVP